MNDKLARWIADQLSPAQRAAIARLDAEAGLQPGYGASSATCEVLDRMGLTEVDGGARSGMYAGSASVNVFLRVLTDDGRAVARALASKSE